MKVKSVFMFSHNLNVAAFDETGQQIPELQKPCWALWAEYAESKGFDPEGIILETPTGNWRLTKACTGQWNRISWDEPVRDN